jgi:HAD superfamily hydrolase (TIGR01509 family)
MSKFKAVLFDLDGVLIDSEGLYTQFWEATERIYPTGIPDFAHYIKGSNLTKILEHFATEEIRQDVVRRIHDFDANLVSPIFAGAIELLQALQKAGIPAALVTSSDPEKMQRLFSLYPDFPGYFAEIINGGMVTHSKPDPEGYLLAASKLGVAPKDCLVVEDSLQGIQAGLAAGATVAGIATTLLHDIVAAHTPHTFDTILPLPTFLEL